MSESEGIHRSVTWAIAGFLVFKLAINTIVRAIYPFLPAIARGLGISLPAAGALVSIRWAASMGAPFVVGTIGRRRPPTSLMVLGAALFSLGSIVTAATGVFIGAVVGFILLGVAKPLFDIGSTIWIAERVPFPRRGRSFGFVEISWAGGLLVGAPLFAWLMERYGWTAPFWVIGLVTAAGAVVLMLIERGSTSQPTADVARIKDRLDREAIAFLLAASIMSMAIELTFVVLGEWLEMGFGLTLLALGGIGIILGIAELVAEGGVLAFTDRMGSRLAMQVGAAGMVVGFGAIAIFDSSLVAGVAAFTFTLLVFEFAIVSALPLATELRPHDRARFLSIYLAVSAGGRVVADWTGPTLFNRGGLATVAIVGAAASVLALTLITRWMRLPQASR